MNDQPFVSVIIVASRVTDQLTECVHHCLALTYPNKEILVFPDDPWETPDNNLRIIPTGSVSPGEKRNQGWRLAKGELLAFIDDDAYPRADWLSKAVKYFEEDSIAGVGGPGVTPEGDGFWERAGGYVYESLLGGGSLRYRYLPQEQRLVDDFPTCNFLVRKSTMNQLGGFDTHFWPGEDTKFCLDLTKELGKRLIYAPEVLVYHHRRALFRPHLKQVYRYGTHRGYFARKFPETSYRAIYFAPTLMVLSILVLSGLALFKASFRPVCGVLVGGYGILVLISAWLVARQLVETLVVSAGLMTTHFTYGIAFLIGLLSRKI